MGTERILVVDDDAGKRTLMQMRLAASGYDVSVAEDGLRGLSAAHDQQPDLILLDVSMPGLDGHEVLRALKQDHTTQSIPVVMLTCMGDMDSKLAGLSEGADDYLVKDQVDYRELDVRIRGLLSRTRSRINANPLTGLPGNVEIQTRLRQAIASALPYAVIYADLDHFKAYNDVYGFSKGDEVIRFLGQLLVRATQELGALGDFVGHVGGDDFVAITDPASAMAIGACVALAFDQQAPRYYDEFDRFKGGISTADRFGEMRTYPLVGVTLAGISNRNQRYANPDDIATAAAELKHQLKPRPGSKYAIL